MKFCEGKLPFRYGDEIYETYYKVVGDLASGRTPLVIVHGGPAISHEYLVPCADLVASYSIPVIFYDQLGTAKSTHLPDKPYDFWTFDVMISQLVCLIRHFGVEDDFNLLGHSWGGQLSLEYILNHPDKPRGLKHFVIVGSFPSMTLYGRSSEALISKFPDWVKEGMEKGYDDPNAFRKACDVFLAVHGCRLKPMPEEFVRAFDEAFIDPAPHLGLWEHGPLGKWTVVDKLHEVNVPTFVINGRWDMAQDFCQVPFLERIPLVKWVTFQGSSHTPFFEERERFMQLVAAFLET